MRIRATVTLTREYNVDEEELHMPFLDATTWDCVAEQESESLVDDPALLVDFPDTKVTITIQELDATSSRSLIKTG